MQVTETLSAGLKREYKVVVNQAELDQELNAKLADLSKRANIRGFRPGKVDAAPQAIEPGRVQHALGGDGTGRGLRRRK